MLVQTPRKISGCEQSRKKPFASAWTKCASEQSENSPGIGAFNKAIVSDGMEECFESAQSLLALGFELGLPHRLRSAVLANWV
jgi:hypothetical protein